MGFFNISKRYGGLDAKPDPLLNGPMAGAAVWRQLDLGWRRPPETWKSIVG
jgi:hypothetical protein